jgi:hypothetical protein
MHLSQSLHGIVPGFLGLCVGAADELSALDICSDVLDAVCSPNVLKLIICRLKPFVAVGYEGSCF